MERFADLMGFGLYNCDCEWGHVTYERGTKAEVEYEGEQRRKLSTTLST